MSTSAGNPFHDPDGEWRPLVVPLPSSDHRDEGFESFDEGCCLRAVAELVTEALSKFKISESYTDGARNSLEEKLSAWFLV